MATIDIRIPQLGEGLQEARLVRFMKQPGDTVERDEPIFEMETDKALLEIEAPAAGIMGEWTVHEDDIVPIGTVIGRIQALDSASTSLSVNGSAPKSSEPLIAQSPEPPRPFAGLRNAVIPPRTRAYAKDKGLTEDDLTALASRSTGRLLPQDVDDFIALAARPAAPAATSAAGAPVAYREVELPPRQRALAYHFTRSAQSVIPATIEMPVRWDVVEAARDRIKDRRLGISQFTLFAWCVSRAAAEHPRFRSTMMNDGKVREYDHLNLGVAVARPGDELVIARLDAADALPFGQFVSSLRNAIERARAGEDQSSESVQLIVTHMGATGARIGIPVVVSPAMAVLFVASPFDEAYPLPGGGVGFHRIVNMVMTFDHRLANGIGAVDFMNSIKSRAEGLLETVDGLS